MEVGVLLLLFGAGVLAGVLNTVGGGGSVLTLPALIFAGVPPVAANGTNRIGIIAQGIVAARQFRRGGIHENQLTPRAIAVGLPAAGLGAYLAARIPDAQFEKVLGVLMLVLLALILAKPKPHLAKEGEAPHDLWSPLTRSHRIGALFAFALLGFYAGFIQAGAGILILVLLGWAAKIDLVRANYVKLVFILALNILVLLVFWWQVEIHWVAGLAITLGQMLGAWLGSWIALEKGEGWMKAILTVAILLSSAELLGVWEWLRG
jgi:uncharacterized membrane protein YfcA